MKICRDCKESKPLEDFNIDGATRKRWKDGYNSRCKSCLSKLGNNYYLNNIEHIKNLQKKRWVNYVASGKYKYRYRGNTSNHKYMIKHKFGLLEEEYNKLLLNQNNKCAICNEQTIGKYLHVDHCHETNKIRGLLCGNCNRGLGLFKDNPEFTAKATAYLKEHQHELREQSQKAIQGEDS